VDYLSVGGLTHSSPILDLALDLVEEATPAPAVGQDVGAVGSTTAQQR
jgi:hypothetical protein